MTQVFDMYLLQYDIQRTTFNEKQQQVVIPKV